MSRNYYCLIAGLPEIHLEDNKLFIDSRKFKEEVYENLDKDDIKIIESYLWRFDNENLIQFLEKDEPDLDSRGVFNMEDLEEFVQMLKEDENSTDPDLPDYFRKFIPAYLNEASVFPDLSWEDQLSYLYFDQVKSSSNSFASEWYTFEMNLNNILAALICRKYNLSPETKIIGSGYVPDSIRSSALKDFGLSDYEFFDDIQKIAEIENLQEREYQTDLLKWRFIDDRTFFNYFSVEKVLAYFIKLGIVERWLELDKETGEKLFRELLESMKTSYEFPEVFSLNKK
jgi:hypothetical protein